MVLAASPDAVYCEPVPDVGHAIRALKSLVPPDIYQHLDHRLYLARLIAWSVLAYGLLGMKCLHWQLLTHLP